MNNVLSDLFNKKANIKVEFPEVIKDQNILQSELPPQKGKFH